MGDQEELRQQNGRGERGPHAMVFFLIERAEVDLDIGLFDELMQLPDQLGRGTRVEQILPQIAGDKVDRQF